MRRAREIASHGPVDESVADYNEQRGETTHPRQQKKLADFSRRDYNRAVWMV